METTSLSTANAKATGISFGGWGDASKVGSNDCVAAATAEVEIRRGPFAVSPLANGACSCSEGVRQPVRDLSLSISLSLSLSIYLCI